MKIKLADFLVILNHLPDEMFPKIDALESELFEDFHYSDVSIYEAEVKIELCK